MVELKCETDFSAKSADFVELVSELTELVVSKGVDAVAERADEIDALKITKKENIDLGKIVRFEAADGNILDSYLHLQDGRGVNAVLIELQGGDKDLAHDIAVHVAFAKPPYLTRDQVDPAAVEKEKQALTEITKAEGKPEAALPKIVEGRLNAWYKDQVLLEQGFVRDDKKSIQQLLDENSATLVRFAQVYIGA
jgi:elongation factor Ts